MSAAIIAHRVASRSVRYVRARPLYLAVPALLALGFAAYQVYRATIAPLYVGDLSHATEMAVDRLDQNPTSGQIMLILREKAGSRRLAMVVGDVEASTIFAELQGTQSRAPMTYDLLGNLISGLGARLNHVIVSNVTESTYYAKMVLVGSSGQVEIDSRPSDAIALALRLKAPIFAESSVLDKAGIVSPN